MNYSEMTDFEINCAVALTLGMSHAFYIPKSQDDFYEGIDVKDRGPIWQSGKHEVKGYRVSNGNCFNPCNSWADAGPIIVENKISLSNTIIRWNASSLVYDDKFDTGFKIYRSDSGVDSSSRGALRAAMIVFLMMQESK